MLLTMPTELFSSIDFLFESREKTGDLHSIKGVFITSKAYQRTCQDPFLKKISPESDRTSKETWAGEAITINGKYYPPLEYTLFKTKNGVYIDTIDYNGEHFEFDSVPYIVIDYAG